MADPFKMVVLIVFIGGMVQIAKYYYGDQKRKRGTDRPDELTAHKIQVLEERIKVLEEIVTDDRRQLRREIDSL